MPLNGNNPPRTNFRPPWVKENAPATTAAANKPAWARRTPAETKAETSKEEPGVITKAVEVVPATSSTPAKKTTAIKITPKENGQVRPAPTVTTKLQSREIKVPIMTEKQKPAPIPIKKPEPKEREINLVVERETAKPKPKVIVPPPKKPVEVEEEEDDEEEESEYETETETETEESEEEEEEEVIVEPPKRPAPPAPKAEVVAPLKKIITKIPEKPTPAKDKSSSERSSSPEPKLFNKPTLKKVNIPPEKKIPERSSSPEPKFIRPQLRKVPSSLKEPRKREKIPEVQLKRAPEKQLDDGKDKEKPFPLNLKPSMLKSESSARIPPPPPCPPGPPPPPPPPPALKPPPDFEKKPISAKQQKVLDKLKTRPRRRPDWSEMMKEVEDGRKLRHVECNDRSQPIITCKSMAKVQGQFIYETEKATVHNKLLKQIQGGINLKPVKTNDRSRPLLDGLRKFRRQMTIEEQILKSESRANLAEMKPVESEEDEMDEMDDIDKVRDDLQSTKQLLALELRNREAQERENKRLQTRLQNLEAELERVLWKPLEPDNTDSTPDDDLVKSLKKEAVEAQNTSKQLEQKYHDIASELDRTKIELEEQKRIIAAMNKRHSVQGSTSIVDSRRMMETAAKDSSPEPELEESEEEEEEENEEKKAEKAAKKLNREVKMLETKLDRLKEKQEAAQKERKNLRDAMKKNQLLLKGEKKIFKKLQREVEKMAALMKDDADEDDEEKEEPEEEPEEEEEEESEDEESETEESESETETESESEAEDASDEQKKSNLEPRVKRHDGRLSSLKKGNYLLQANVDRLKDEIKKQTEASAQLKSDLDSVISDLG